MKDKLQQCNGRQGVIRRRSGSRYDRRRQVWLRVDVTAVQVMWRLMKTNTETTSGVSIAWSRFVMGDE